MPEEPACLLILGNVQQIFVNFCDTLARVGFAYTFQATTMIRLFKHYVPHAVLLLGLLDCILLITAAELGWTIRQHQLGSIVEGMMTRAPQLLVFAGTLQITMVAVGVYGSEALQSLRFAAARLSVGVAIGVIALSAIFFLVPALSLWRSNLLYAMGLSILLLMVLRILLGKTLGGQAFNGGVGRGPARGAGQGAEQAAGRGVRLRRLCIDVGIGAGDS
jgi:hypothetical protein